MVALDVDYNGTIIALSTGIAFIGAFAAVSLCEQYRLSTTANATSNPLVLMAFVAFSLGGVGIWCMHFISTASFRLTNDGTEIPVRFNVPMLVISLVVVCVFEFAGLYCASTDSCFNKSKKEIMEMFIARASNKYSMSEIKQMSKLKILTIVCTHSPERIIIGGIIAGGGVAIMHYLGMMSMEFQGTVKYNPGLVALSVIVAVLAVIGGFWIFFRVLSLFPSLDILRVACALNGMFSLSGVHYIGLVSATYHYDATREPPDTSNSIGSQQMLTGVLAASVIFCVIMQVYVMADLRGWLFRTSGQLRQAENVVNTLRSQHGTQARSPTSTSSTTARELYKYLAKYHKATSDADTDNMSVGLYNDFSDEEEDEKASDYPRDVSRVREKSTHKEQNRSRGNSAEEGAGAGTEAGKSAARVHNKPDIKIKTAGPHTPLSGGSAKILPSLSERDTVHFSSGMIGAAIASNTEPEEPIFATDPNAATGTDEIV